MTGADVWQGGRADRDGLLRVLGRLRNARIGTVRAPHKPLLLLWLFGRFAATGSSRVSYADAEGPLSRLINDFGPPAGPAIARQRAAMPFVHLEPGSWQVQDGAGVEIGADVPERRGWLVERGVVGWLHPEVEHLLSVPAPLASAARLPLELHFTPVLAELICAEVGLDLPVLDAAGHAPVVPGGQSRRRRSGFAEEVLRAYAYRCAMCGFDGALGRNPVGIEAAHVRWHSQSTLASPRCSWSVRSPVWAGHLCLWWWFGGVGLWCGEQPVKRRVGGSTREVNM